MALPDVLQVIGAVLILIPFAALQFGRMSSASAAYLWLNLVGSGLLAALALRDQQWGFLLLEGIWALVAAWGLVALTGGGRPSSGHAAQA